MTRKEKLAKRKSLFSLARYLVAQSKKKIDKMTVREHKRQEALLAAENPPKEDKKLKKHPWMAKREDAEVVVQEPGEVCVHDDCDH